MVVSIFGVLADTTMFVISKDEQERNTETVRCSAARMRPFTLMRTSAKIVTLGVNRRLEDLAMRSVVCPQRGFVVGRRIDEDAIGFDSAMATVSLNSFALKCALRAAVAVRETGGSGVSAACASLGERSGNGGTVCAFLLAGARPSRANNRRFEHRAWRVVDSARFRNRAVLAWLHKPRR